MRGFSLTVIFFFFPLLLSYAAHAIEKYRIVIDPGHGGSETGAVRDSFVESQIVLKVAEKVKNILSKKDSVDVTLTRDSDILLPLQDRVNLANNMNADLFVSIHANSASQNFLSGMEFYFNAAKPRKKKTTEVSNENYSADNSKADTLPGPEEVIAKIKNDFLLYQKTEKSLLLSKSFKEKTSSTDKKSVIKRAPFYVVENTKMPSVLVELGFITNRREAKKLSSDEHQEEIARLLADAILEYKEKSDKAPGL